jgi:hypothetical protein
MPTARASVTAMVTARQRHAQKQRTVQICAILALEYVATLLAAQANAIVI